MGVQGIAETANELMENIYQANQAAKKGRISADDYYGNDGLLYCGKCHTQKETVLRFPKDAPGGNDIRKKVRCRCKCESEELERRRKELNHKQEMMKIERLRSTSLMDSKYLRARFDCYRETPGNRKAVEVARRYVANFDQMFAENQGLIFYGPVGSGKSFTAACIANALLEKCISVVMTSFVKILQGVSNMTGSEYINILNKARLLILDDLGTERNTDFALEKVYNVIDSRSRANMPMILTTNLNLSEMLDSHDIRYRRIYDRILETCYPVDVLGDSFRRKSAEVRFDRMQKILEGRE